MPILRHIVRRSSATCVKTHVSTLANGIRVASENIPGHFASVGVYVDAGSRYENPDFSGLSHFNEKLAYRSTQSSSMESIMNTLENIGGNIMCTALKEHIVYQASVFKHDIKDSLRLMAETVTQPMILPEEIEEAQNTIRYELQEAFAKPEWRVPELAHQAAFYKNTYGVPSVFN